MHKWGWRNLYSHYDDMLEVHEYTVQYLGNIYTFYVKMSRVKLAIIN